MQKLESLSGIESANAENPFAALLSREANLQPVGGSPLDALLGKTVTVDIIRVETADSIFEVNLTRAIDHSKDFQWAEPKPVEQENPDYKLDPQGQRLIKWCTNKNCQVFGDSHRGDGRHRHVERFTIWVPESRASQMSNVSSTEYRANRQTQRRSSSGRRINAAKADAI